LSFSAKVYQVAIVAAGDVSKERTIIKGLINEWNELNAYNKKCVLLPVGCEVFSSPDQESSAQDSGSSQNIKNCDLVIGAFWTKIGPAGVESIDDTLVKLESYIATGKPAILNFSNAPVIMDNIDQDEYNRLLDLKNRFKDSAHIMTYDNIGDFQNKLGKLLAKMSFNHDQRKAGGLSASKKTSPAISPLAGTSHIHAGPVSPSAREGGSKELISSIMQKLTPHAMELLLEAGRSIDGSIMRLPTLDGIMIQANRQIFVEEDESLKVSRWEIALEDLEIHELIKDTGLKGEVYKVTQLGYQLIEQVMKSDS